jgi:hypothetical protein
MKFRFFLAASVLSFSSGAQGQIRAVRPPHTAAANEELGSSGIDAGDTCMSPAKDLYSWTVALRQILRTKSASLSIT